MRRAIKRQPPPVPAFEIRLVGEDGPRVLGACTASQRGGELDLEMNQQRALSPEQQRACTRVFNGPAAKGQNKRIASRQPRNRLLLALAEGRFSMAAEQFGYRAAGLGFDRVV